MVARDLDAGAVHEDRHTLQFLHAVLSDKRGEPLPDQPRAFLHANQGLGAEAHQEHVEAAAAGYCTQPCCPLGGGVSSEGIDVAEMAAAGEEG